MSENNDFSSYEDIFGEIDFREGDEARSVLSPAAYLADLLQLYEDEFREDEPDGLFAGRRGDIKDIPLDEENTFTTIPYLDIANEIMQNKVGTSPYSTLMEEIYPFNLPFNLENEKVKQYLKYLKVTPEELYKLFKVNGNDAEIQNMSDRILAREYLGLSEKEYDLLFNTGSSVNDLYGTEVLKLPELKKAKEFMSKAGISYKELKELLYQNLRQKPGKGASHQNTEVSSGLADNFYINAFVEGTAALDASEEEITGIADANFSDWLKRAGLFIRLAKKTGMAFTDLDMILRSCCGNILDQETIKIIAVVNKLCKTYELPADEICAFFSSMNTVGLGDDEEPTDLFNRVYNGKLTGVDKKYIKVTDLLHAEYEKEAYSELVPVNAGNILHADNQDFTKRICKALSITSDDIKLIVDTFIDRGASGRFDLSSADNKRSALSLLFRIAKLTQTLGITIKELFNILDVLNGDPLIRNYSNFDVLISKRPTEKNCYMIISGDNVFDSMWLIQLVAAMAEWMQEYDFTAEELKNITTRQQLIKVKDGEKTEESMALEKERAAKIEFLNNLYAQFKPIMFHEDAFISDIFDKRASRAIYRHLTKQQGSMVSKNDARLVLCADEDNAEELKAVAYEALSRLEEIQTEDFMDIGIEERITGKIFNNLYFGGYINSTGDIDEENFPAVAEDFCISADFSDCSDSVFGVIKGLCEEAAKEEESIEDVQIKLYPNDFLETLDLSVEEVDELYDNLIFNFYIDEEGNLIDPSYFSDDENMIDFQVNADIFDYSDGIYTAITDNMKKFKELDIVLDRDIFKGIGLTGPEIDTLIKNLYFNEYIDKYDIFADKTGLLNTKVEDFKLAMAFYPYRHQILEAIKKQILEYKAYFYNVNETMVNEIAGKIAASKVYETIAQNYLEDGLMTDEGRSFFNDQSNMQELDLGDYFSNNEEVIVFSYISKLLKDVEKYKLQASVLADMQLDEQDQADLIDALEDGGYIFDGMVCEDKTDYFMDVNNALDFKLESFEDFNKDIFFALHAAAKEINEAITNLAEILSGTAKMQKDTLLTALQDVYGIKADIIQSILSGMYLESQNAVEQYMVPVLKAVGKNDIITTEPDNSRFNQVFRRVRQFALLVSKLGLTKEEAEVAFSEQNLVQKFPESLILPAGVTEFSVILEGVDDKIYLFTANNYYVYSKEDYSLIRDLTKTVQVIKKADKDDELFKGLTAIDYFYYKYSNEGAQPLSVDAAFADKDGTVHIISGTNYYYKEKDDELWKNKVRRWGVVENNFKKIDRVDASFVDKEGKTYLFSKDQYIRYSSDSHAYVDEGYPRSIQGNWADEFEKGELNENFSNSIDASCTGIDGKTYIFKDGNYICTDDYTEAFIINEKFGRVKNNFDDIEKVDAAFTMNNKYYIFSKDQVICYRDNLENDGLNVEEGFPKSIDAFIPNLPHKFKNGIDAVVEDSGKIHMFKDGECVEVTAGSNNSFTCVEGSKAKSEARWGKVRNSILETDDAKRVSAAFTGLDGKVYLFSKDQYYCYSGKDYSRVDDGYPKLISSDWGRLTSVDAAFILDEKTYICGTDNTGTKNCVCYSTNDYKTPDEGYPKAIADNWWNLPFTLTGVHTPVFDVVNTVFTDKNGRTYLFSGDMYIYFDNKHRWWSEPKSISGTWDGISKVDAAFTGKDGKTYIFSGDNCSRYSGRNYSKVDDRYPNRIIDFWGNVDNNIKNTGKIDASLAINFTESNTQKTYVYLFSGNQFFRYTKTAGGSTPEYVDEGYPKDITARLKEEPCFKNLDVSLKDGVDAALAAKRNIYLFKDYDCHIIVESLSGSLTRDYDIAADCAFINDGSIYKRAGADWYRCGDMEAKGASITQTPLSELQLPPLLRKIPAGKIGSVNAVLEGTDGEAYAFIGDKCYNYLMDKEYSIGEEWGRVDNNITKNKTVDAAFVGVDGNTYMFGGDQYVVYEHKSNPPTADEYLYIKSVPKSITDDFAGLTNVAAAFVKDDKTYLFEKPDERGKFRYIQYSGRNYSKPDNGFPKTIDTGWWNIPEQYVEEGFDGVDAVYVEGDNIYLFHEDKYLQYNQKEDIWSYPKPLDRMWKDIPVKKVKTLFKGVDGSIYFFHEGGYSRLLENGTFEILNSSPKPYEDQHVGYTDKHWGRVDNKIVVNNRVDAAFVHNNKTTYLFSADQYARYSTSDYRYVDKGYPKKIYENLRYEEGFKDIDPYIGKTDSTYAGEAIIKAAISNKGSIYIFTGSGCKALAQGAVRYMDISGLGYVRNNILMNNKVDAAFGDKDRTFLLSGDQYVRYSRKTYEYVDEGYPKPIKELCGEDLGITSLPENFKYDIDAAFLKNGEPYLFKGNKFYFRNVENDISTRWGIMQNVFEPDSHLEDMVPVNAAFIAPDGALYVFKNDQYIRYSNIGNEYVDEGYPKSIINNWGNLPSDFESSIDSAFVFENKTYMIKGGSYVRYSDNGYGEIDSIYPQNLIDRWGGFSDYLLTDINVIARFNKLHNEYIGEQYTLADLLHTGKYQIEEPYEALANIFDWNEEEVKWLKRKNTFLGGNGIYEVDFNLEAVIKMYDILTATEKMGISPLDLYEKVWRNIYSLPQAEPALSEAAKNLYTCLGSINSQKDWEVLSEQLHDEENILKRDAMVPYLLHVLSGAMDFNVRDLYEKLLIDIQMDGCARTSRIKEALECIQLYFHRYFIDLESPQTDGTASPADVKEKLKKYWKWMKNYRVWEANRKVFLYPENYIRPELRDNKTEQFKALEEEIMKGELSAEMVEKAYRGYLDSYGEVSRLTVSGGCVYDSGSGTDKKVILFGRTKTEPGKYFYRTATFIAGDTNSAQWDSWIDTKLQIDSDKVYPVFAFGKTFVFWTKLEINERGVNKSAKATKSGDNYEFSKTEESEKVLRIYYSYQDLNNEWIPPQTLDKEIVLEGGKSPAFVELHVSKEIQYEGKTHENILINCSYFSSDVEWLLYNIFKWFPELATLTMENKVYRLMPELYTVEDTVDRADPLRNSAIDLFKDLFKDDTVNNLKEENAIVLSTNENPWFAFDYKGGSFLCKPSAGVFDFTEWPKDLAFDPGITDAGYTGFKDYVTNHKINDSFRLGNNNYILAGDNCYQFNGDIMDNSGYMNPPTGSFAVAEKFGKVQVDNAFTVDVAESPTTYVIRGGKYSAYEPDNYLKTKPDGYLKEIHGADGSDNLLKTLTLSQQGWSSGSSSVSLMSLFGPYPSDGIFAVFCHGDGLYISKHGPGAGNSPLIGFGNYSQQIIDAFKTRYNNETVIDVDAVFSWDGRIWVLEKSVAPVNTSLNPVYFITYDPIQNVWGSTQTFITNGAGIPGNNQEMTRYDAFVHNGKIYIIKDNQYMQLDSITEGVDITWSPDLDNSTIGFEDGSVGADAAFSYDGKIFIIRGGVYSCCTDMPKKVSGKSVLLEQYNLNDEAGELNQIYLGKLDISGVDSAFYYEDTLYLGREHTYYPVTADQGLVILSGGSIKTAFYHNNRIWMYKQDGTEKYFDIFEKSQTNGYRRITVNVKEGGSSKALTAAFTDGTKIYLMAGNQYKALQGVDIETAITSHEIQWSNPAVNLFRAMQTVDGTYVHYASDTAAYLYVFSDGQYIRYTIGSSHAIPEYVDEGYPQKLEQYKFSADASYTISNSDQSAGKRYLFKKGSFLSIGNAEDPYAPGFGWGTLVHNIKAIDSNFMNLPKYFTSGFDAALNFSTYLYLFKDNKYIKYDMNSLAIPYNISDVKYDIIRLTASTSGELSKKLFTEGMDKYLSIDTQRIGEFPKFSVTDSSPSTICVNENKVNINTLPMGNNLDYRSANSTFYWEMFFHIPMLIAQSLNTEQKFEEAKKWYEYVFDPTQGQYWRFQPFAENHGDSVYGIDETRDMSLNPVNPQIIKYLEDPFDPHAIAFFRMIAYEKAAVMSYIDNLIDWGDMLFGQYTAESLNEARMLYVLAYDLLGEKPESLGRRNLTEVKTYSGLTGPEGTARNNDHYEFLLELEDNIDKNLDLMRYIFSGGTAVQGANNSIINPYFHIPENWFFINYWNTVEDRLYKIRHCMNIMGMKQPLPLFEPPIDPMALVQAIGSGMSLSQAVEGLDASVPHYRFRFMLEKAKELVSRLNQFGDNLLGTLEKSDAEELGILQNKQENTIMSMTRGIKKAQLDEAKQNTISLEHSLKNAEDTIKHYTQLISEGLTSKETAQIALTIAGSAYMESSALAKLLSIPVSALPKPVIGVFTYGQIDLAEAINRVSEFGEMSGEAASMAGEVIGIYAQYERMKQDWELQLAMAESEKKQLEAQIAGAKLGEEIAKREIDLLEEQIRQNESVKTFMKDKFTNKQLYNWMASKLSSLYFQTYKLAYGMARYAQKAFQFERGIKEGSVNYISSVYWDSLRKGLLSGESLGLDLDRMEKAYIETNSRSLEIAKPISLLELDPLAFIDLKNKGACEFNLTEALFDYDFQGHYCRQVKTISITFDMGENAAPVNATLTQLSHKTVMEPDTKAVRYLLEPKDSQPLTIRADWRSKQQIVLSPRGEEENNGLFELRYDDDRYLPFEGTGAVSRWRLQLNGRRGSFNPGDIRDVVVNLKYTALQGGEAFGDAVRGMLKPYTAAKYISFEEDFSDKWEGYLNSSDSDIALTFTRDMFPNMTGSRIDGICMVSEMYEEGKVSAVLNNGREYNLVNGKYVETSGLSISSSGSEFKFTIEGDIESVKNVGLIIFYKASV